MALADVQSCESVTRCFKEADVDYQLNAAAEVEEREVAAERGAAPPRVWPVGDKGRRHVSSTAKLHVSIFR